MITSSPAPPDSETAEPSGQAGAVHNPLLLARGSAYGIDNPLYTRELVYDSYGAMSRTRNARVGMTLALGTAIAAGGALAFFNSHAPRSATVAAESAPQADLGAEESAAAEADGAGLSGAVLEAIPVSKYTYLRLATAQGEVWAAVLSASVAVGSRVTIANANRMDQFKSSTLKRTFDTIYFGTLAPAGAADTPVRKFSPVDVLSQDSQELPAGHPDISGSVAPANAPPVPAVRVSPATGSGAHVIADLTSLRQKLAGQRVRVRGQVTKVTPHVQGHTFFHIRDSSVGPQGAPSDLVVTSDLEPQPGQVATFEGVLRTDVDIGIGYFYPVLLENATLGTD